MGTSEPKPKMRVGIWVVDPPRRFQAEDAGLRQVIASLLGAENTVLLVAEEWRGAALPGLEVQLASPLAQMPGWAKGLLALRARVRGTAGRVRKRLAPLRNRKTLLYLLPLIPLAPLLILVALCYRLLCFSGRRLFHYIERRRHEEAARLVTQIVPGARCDVWLVMSAPTTFPFAPGVRCAWLLDGPPNRPVMPHIDEYETDGWLHAQLRETSYNTTLFLVHSTEMLSNPGLIGWLPVQDRYRVVPLGEPTAWLEVLTEAAALPLSVEELDFPTSRNRPYHVHLFLPYRYRGGVWEAARTLLSGLDAVNRDRGKALRITLALPPGQANLPELAADVPGLSIEWLTQQLLLAADGSMQALPWSPSALRADAWFALVDRFRHPAMTVRPLGVMVYDVIQKFLPSIFPAEFHTEFLPSMRATVARADRIITTNPVTRLDAAAEYGLDLDRVILVPVACEPENKFRDMVRRPVAVPSGHLLNVTNPSPHKGMAIVLRAYARLKERLGGRGPGLVICGHNTDRVSPSYTGLDDPTWRCLRDLIGELGLVPGEDLWLLGYTDDAQLLDLYERCHAVINAAQYDNGTFSLIEAHSFGKPVVCSRYPAAVALYEYFEIPVDYFALDDDEDLAAILFQVMSRPPLTGAELHRCRTALADPKYSQHRHAEQVYQLLLDMARRGRDTYQRAA